MKFRMLLSLAAVGLMATLAVGQNASAPKTAAKTAAKSSPVDDVIGMVKAGFSDSLIIKKLQKENKPVDLSPADMVKLKNAGVSETVMGVMMDPGAPVPAAAPAAAPAAPADGAAAYPAPPPQSAPPPPPTDAAANYPAPAPAPAPSAPPMPPTNAQKKRVIVDEFDYSAVKTSIQAIFGTQQDIGKGIRAMLTTRLAQQGNVVVVERAKIGLLQAEQDRNAGNRVKQGTGAGIGKISGADALLTGDIIIFGRDDKNKGGAASAIGGFCRLCGAAAGAKKTDKAVVAISYRFVDAETSEVIATGEARGESKRTSTNVGAFAGAWGKGGGGGQVDMTSSNFADTIIGEATQDCVGKLADILSTQSQTMTKNARPVEALVADIAGPSMTITAGGNDTVAVGDVFEILRIDREVKDPVTKEVLDRITTKVGELVISSVRDKIATGNYSGSPAAVGFIARKRL
jgi:curli biogenesis system outer membrane secretion channel CsgG